MGISEIWWTGFGSAVISIGMTLVGVYAFRMELVWVILGFGLFVAGYRVMQYGTYGWPDRAPAEIREKNLGTVSKTGLGLLISVCLSAYGFVLMGEAVHTQSIQPMLLSGVSVVLGYIVGHKAANDEVL